MGHQFFYISQRVLTPISAVSPLHAESSNFILGNQFIICNACRYVCKTCRQSISDEVKTKRNSSKKSNKSYLVECTETAKLLAPDLLGSINENEG